MLRRPVRWHSGSCGRNEKENDRLPFFRRTVVWYEESWAEGAAEPPGGRSPPMQAQPADFAEGERRLRRRCGKQGTDNKERGYVSGAAGQVARIEGDSCGGGNCLNLTFCVLAKEDSPATREQGPNSDVEDALNMGWEKTSPRRRGILLGAGLDFVLLALLPEEIAQKRKDGDPGGDAKGEPKGRGTRL